MSAPPVHPLVFPVLKEDKDFIISNFVQTGEVEDFELPFGNVPKGERIGRIADWTGYSADANQLRGGGRRAAAITNTQGKGEEEAEGWSLSLGYASNSNPTGIRRPAQAKPLRVQAPGGPRTGGYHAGGQRDGRFGARGPGGRYRPVERIREPSIKVGPEWKLVEEIEFSRLAKVQINVEDPIVLASHGAAPQYDPAYDKLKAKAEKPFTTEPTAITAPVSASQDAFLQESLAKGEATICTTGLVASLLMSCQRSVLPWDIIVRRHGRSVVFDIRPESKIHLVSVHENAGEAAPEEITEGLNSQHSLSQEATKINAGLPVFLGKNQNRVDLGHAAEPKIGTSYRYSKFNLGEEHSLLIRSEVSNALPNGALTLSKAFLEYDQTSLGWRQKLDTSRGAVLAQAIKNSNAMLSRWVYQALYSGCSALKLAYISRVSPKSPAKHVILGVHDFDPLDLAGQMNLNTANGFGIIRALADLCLGLPDDGEYALVRDANKPMLRLYALPKKA